MMRYRQFKIVILISILIPKFTSAHQFDFQGQASVWGLKNDYNSSYTYFGFRYVPEGHLIHELNSTFTLDGECSFNIYSNGELQKLSSVTSDSDFKPYRIWARIASSQFEARLGLQKLNFGPAMLLRPLMWFDSIDPRDPLQVTDGVYGLLFKYYFVNNANIWLWGLYGNDKLKGWEFIPSDKKSPEVGGRVQIPVSTGEMAVTYHRRQVDATTILDSRYTSLLRLLNISESDLKPMENRIGLDGKWDVSVGVWFEGALSHYETDLIPQTWTRAFTLGMDYTFGIGNGLHAVGEYFQLKYTEKAFGSGEGVTFFAGSFGYPVGILDNLQAIFFYDQENEDFYHFLNWQRTYDSWSFHIITFWNPDSYQIYQTQTNINLMSGKGIQIMAVFDH